MTNEAKVYLGTTKTLKGAGILIANNAMAQADDAAYDIAVDGLSYPDAEFVLAVTFAVAPTEMSTLDLYARELGVDGANDSEAPEASGFKHLYIGSFHLNNVTTTQYEKLVAHDVPRKAAYYLYNNATGQSVSAGWTLKITPRTIGPAA